MLSNGSYCGVVELILEYVLSLCKEISVKMERIWSCIFCVCKEWQRWVYFALLVCSRQPVSDAGEGGNG